MYGYTIDTPTNGITLCRKLHHQGIIHPDMAAARRNYHNDPKSFEKAFARRNIKIENGFPYWCTEYDSMLARISVKLTQRYIQKTHDKFPYGKRSKRHEPVAKTSKRANSAQKRRSKRTVTTASSK